MTNEYSGLLAGFGYCRAAARPNAWHVRCPVAANHRRSDRNPSAMIWVGRDGELRFWCAKGCRWQEAVRALGTRPTDWFPPRDKHAPRRRLPVAQKIVATYDYTDAAGELIYQVVRTEPKGFFQRRPVPGRPGQWINTLSGGDFSYDRPAGLWREQLTNYPVGSELVHLKEIERVPYRLPDLADPARRAHAVLVVEGEGKADLLRSLGFTATCSSGGAGKWPVSFGVYLAGRRVVVFPDADEVGLGHAALVAASALVYEAASVRVVRAGMGWEALGPAQDVRDWLDRFPLDPEERRLALINLVKMQPEWRPQ